MTEYYYASSPFTLTPPPSSPLPNHSTALDPSSNFHWPPHQSSQTEVRPFKAEASASYSGYTDRIPSRFLNPTSTFPQAFKSEVNCNSPNNYKMYMGTYRRPSSYSVDIHQAHGQSASQAQPSQAPQQQQQQQQEHTYQYGAQVEPCTGGDRKQYATSRPPVAMHSQPDLSGSRTVSRPDSPVFNEKQPPSNMSGPGSIASYLLLPATISPNGGSLAEFAAKITCLFWFESQTTLVQIQDGQNLPLPTARLDTGFLKWVTTILTTTQVSPNVILLALLFIYRLKSQNPSVKGKPGSEFRLLTVALMLGNKFLDDNTYTNKTWAEVSGIAVQEIHVMEVEFLSHMKYNLYTSKEDWLQWHDQLKTFWSYFDRVNRIPKLQHPLTLRPLNLSIPSTLPSPPNSTSASPPYHTSASPHPNHYTPHPTGSAYLTPASGYADPEVRLPPRKRSWDEVAMALEPQAKRPYGYHPHSANTETPLSGSLQNLPHLPPLNVQYNIANYQQNMNTAPQLPVPAMSSARSTPVASLPPMNWTPNMHGSAGPQSRAASRPSSFAFTGSNNPSPTSQAYASSAAHSSNGNQLSPSHYLHQRNSPYKPVRNISTLLVPPPTSHLPQHTPISYDQMHWQPLGRATEQRTGRVPYLHREVWPNHANEWSAYPSQ